MAAPLALRFVRSASLVEQLPSSLIELAIVGRSNVGKSSLLNALANHSKLARTSKSPGATRLLNVFELDPVDSGRWIVDLPGYGFAKVPAKERRRWQGMIDGYLTEREELAMVLLLIDGEVGPTKLDLQTVEWLGSIGLTVRFIATKSDKVSSSKRPNRKREVAEKLGVEPGDVAWVSAAKGWGIPELRTEIKARLQAT